MSNMTLAEQLRAKLAERELAQWAKDDEAHNKMEKSRPSPTKPFAITNNLCRVAFEQIRDFPDTRKNVNEVLKQRGYHISSISAIVGQMIRQGVAQADDEGVLHVTTAEYTPLKSASTMRNLTKKTKQKKLLVDVRKKTVRVEEERPVSSSVGAGIAAIPMRPKDPPHPKPLPWSPREILEMMDVLQARAVYDELKKLFGDVK